MARGRLVAGWWREPPWWAWALMVVGAVFLAVGLPIAWSRGQLSPAEVQQIEQGEQPTAAGSPTASPTQAPARRVVAIGDEDTAGTAEGGTGNAGWPALLEQRIPGIRVDVAAAPGAGFAVASTATGRTIPQLAAAAPVENAAVVVVFGSRNDGSGVADRVGAAAGETFQSILARAPAAKLIVIGPPWVGSEVPARVRNNRGYIREAALAVGATFVDPLAENWLTSGSGLIGADGVHLTDAGHAHLADLIEPTVRQALGA